MRVSYFEHGPLFWLLVAGRVQAQGPMNAQVPMSFKLNGTSVCDAACLSLVNILGDRVYYQDFPSGFFKDYYSERQREIVPACVVLPTSAAEVSDVINVIKQHDCIFTPKSGGHAMFAGASNAPGGITIDLRYLNQVQLSEDLSTAHIGSGNRWRNVYDALDPMNVTVVGGRDSTVGVGGFLLGGGISFISRRYGWGMDNVRNYEIVLANGSISNISYSTHPDLYWALRGGGSNFGIVTRFDMEVHPLTPMWGGFNIALFSDFQDQLSSLEISRPFSFSRHWLFGKVGNIANSVACLVGYCVTFDRAANLLEKMYLEADPDSQAYVCFVMLPYINIYGLAVQPSHGGALSRGFSDLLEMKKVYATNRMTTATGLARELSDLNAVEVHRVSYEAATFKFSTALIKAILKIYISEIEAIRPKVPGLFSSLPIQVITKEEISHSFKNGGNPLGLAEADAPLMHINVAVGWDNQVDDEIVLQTSKNIIYRAIEAGKQMDLGHPFMYQNYGAGGQDIFAGYGKKNRERLREIQKKYDPEGLFERLKTGYFRI